MTDSRITPRRNYDARVHYGAALLSGFIGSSTVYGLAGSYGSAWTANAIAVITNAFNGRFDITVIRIIGALLYALPIGVVTWMKKNKPQINLKYVSLVMVCIASVFLTFLPDTLPAPVGLWPSYVAMAFAWCAFPGAYGYSCAVMMNTNNMRQFVTGFTEVYINHDESHRLKMKFYGLDLLWFHVGVVIMCILWKIFGFARYTNLFAILLCAAEYVNISIKAKE